MPFSNKIYREVDGAYIPGTFLQAFIKNGKHHFVVEIKIYKDGVIDCWEKVDFDGFKACVRRGWVKTQLPDGARVSMMTGALLRCRKHEVQRRKGGIYQRSRR